MDYLYYSVLLFNVATYGYLLASMVLIFNLITKNDRLIKVFKVMALVIVASHTSALLLRWVQAGFDRPPWTNLYESLIFFTWGLGMVSTVVIFKYRTYFLATFLYPLAFAGLGLAAMVPDKSLTPLVPSLQSYWIKIHVVMASMAYPGFITASVISLTYLLKSKTRIESLAIGFSAVALFALLIVGRSGVFFNGVYEVNQTLFDAAGHFSKIPIDPSAKPVEFVQAVIPGAGALFWATALSLLAAILYAIGAMKDVGNKMWSNMLRFFLITAQASFGLLLAIIYYNISLRDDVSINSNMYEMAILWMAFGVGIFFLIYTFNREAIDAFLPAADWLDEFAYKITLFAFPFMTLLLITGAIWAYSAWGRYWGWDPKETCALLTWMIFAGYLHSRRYFGTMGRPAAVINIVGGLSVFFTFLGANLVLSGLHSYGAQ